jgi:hypothetical protein
MFLILDKGDFHPEPGDFHQQRQRSFAFAQNDIQDTLPSMRLKTEFFYSMFHGIQGYA